MCSRLGRILTNIFVEFHEGLLFDKCRKVHVYLRYVDDSFSIFDSVNDAAAFFAQLNSFHTSLQFNMVVESDSTLPNLDDLVERSDDILIFCNSIFTGLYTCWDFFPLRPARLKTRNHDLMICFPNPLNEELASIQYISVENVLPLNVINYVTEGMVKHLRSRRFSDRTCVPLT